MRLLGRDFSPEAVARKIEAKLEGLVRPVPETRALDFSGPEPTVNPYAFYVNAMAEFWDPTQGMPTQTHRSGAGGLVLVAKKVFRKLGRPFINETLGRQRVFNEQIRDGFSLMAAEINRLRVELENLKVKRNISNGE